MLALLVFRHRPLLPEGAHGWYISLVPLLLRMVRPRRQLDERVQRNLHPRAFLLRHVHVVGVDAPEHRLVRDDDHVLAPFQLHDDRLKADDHVPVGLAPAIAVVVFVLVASGKVFGVDVGDFFVREAVAHAGVELVESFPFQLGVHARAGGKEASGLDGTFEGGGPDGQFSVVADGLVDQRRERLRIQLAT